VGLLTGDVSVNPDAPCLIMTTEIRDHSAKREAYKTRPDSSSSSSSGGGSSGSSSSSKANSKESSVFIDPALDLELLEWVTQPPSENSPQCFGAPLPAFFTALCAAAAEEGAASHQLDLQGYEHPHVTESGQGAIGGGQGQGQVSQGAAVMAVAITGARAREQGAGAGAGAGTRAVYGDGTAVPAAAALVAHLLNDDWGGGGDGLIDAGGSSDAFAAAAGVPATISSATPDTEYLFSGLLTSPSAIEGAASVDSDLEGLDFSFRQRLALPRRSAAGATDAEVDPQSDASAVPTSTSSTSSSSTAPRSRWAVTASLPDAAWEALKPHLARTFPFELDHFQKQAIMRLERNESVFVAAHTSAGKTGKLDEFYFMISLTRVACLLSFVFLTSPLPDPLASLLICITAKPPTTLHPSRSMRGICDRASPTRRRPRHIHQSNQGAEQPKIPRFQRHFWAQCCGVAHGRRVGQPRRSVSDHDH